MCCERMGDFGGITWKSPMVTHGRLGENQSINSGGTDHETPSIMHMSTTSAVFLEMSK